MGKRSFTRVNRFQHNIAAGRENDWRCRAGSRYLYICEDGFVHYCSQQRGYPGIALCGIHRRAAPARIPDEKRLRAALHGFLRSPDIGGGWMAQRRKHLKQNVRATPSEFVRSTYRTSGARLGRTLAFPFVRQRRDVLCSLIIGHCFCLNEPNS